LRAKIQLGSVGYFEDGVEQRAKVLGVLGGLSEACRGLYGARACRILVVEARGLLKGSFRGRRGVQWGHCGGRSGQWNDVRTRR